MSSGPTLMDSPEKGTIHPYGPIRIQAMVDMRMYLRYV